MTFIPAATLVGRTYEHKDIVVVGDVAEGSAIQIGKQMSSAWESVYEQALHMAGLTKRDVYFLNLFPDRTNLKGLWVDHQKASKRHFTPEGKVRYEIFMENTIKAIAPKVIVPIGPAAVQAFLGRTDYTDIRGYPFEWNGSLVIPSLHVKDMIWSNYIWRFYLSQDFLRAKEFSEGLSKIIDPELVIPATFEEALAWLIKIEQFDQKRVSIDIEVNNYEVSCIGFSCAPHHGVSIPIDERWTEEEEVKLWIVIARILGNAAIAKIGQNFIFDSYFLTYRMGIIIRGYLEDTMVASHIAFPDFLKGLGFLGSIHTTYRYWKDQADFKNIKEES